MIMFINCIVFYEPCWPTSPTALLDELRQVWLKIVKRKMNKVRLKDNYGTCTLKAEAINTMSTWLFYLQTDHEHRPGWKDSVARRRFVPEL